MIVLGIETSCDETSAAIVDNKFDVKSNIIWSQQDHALYGGVVPELASRAHMRSLVPVVEQALLAAKTSWSELDGIAVTRGPGLVGSLIVGVSAAKGMSLACRKPLVGVHHLEGHIFSTLIENKVETPFLTLLVSGGHTELICVEELGTYRLVGRTRDDAAGEAFDKVAKLLGLLPEVGSIMGGRIISELADRGDPEAIAFPRGLVGNADFSFSGLKTAVLNYVRKLDRDQREAQLADIAASFQAAVVDSLIAKTLAALEGVETDVKAVCIAGGVAANRTLRERLCIEVEKRDVPFYCPSPVYCTDNAAMIGAVGAYRLSLGDSDGYELDAIPRLSLY
ncbi:MAG: tRNA (adenosine(37)-N6)-threonylcarbamoyltransferase complex transferase subunit TsaD [Candidatus Latescibacterota bacterium]|mgnify:CR=1 FL=1|jgi:N6-L-threonylcarbamoyladenine synthase